MRRVLWVLSAPVVAGGLAWTINAVSHQGPLMAGAPQAQNGKILFFSRNGKPSSTTSLKDGDALAAASTSDAAADEESAELPAAPQRYVRNRPAPITKTSASARSSAKNYRELFADSDESAAAPASKSPAPQTAARRQPKATESAPTAKNPTANKPAVVEECGVNDSSDAEVAHEDVQLPPAGKNQLVDGVREAGNVRHAELRTREGAARTSVRTVQHSQKQPASKARSAQSAPSAPPADDDDLAAPTPSHSAPAHTAKSFKPSKDISAKTAEAPAKPTRGTAEPKHAAAKPARKPIAAAAPQNSAKSKPTVSQVAADDDSAAPSISSNVTFAAGSTEDVPMISLRWTKTDEVNVNQECKCGLIVKNTGKMVARDIVVEAFFPRSVKLVDAEPFPNDSKDHLVWIFEHLDPGQEKSIEITMIPGRRGELSTNATVRFTGVATSVVHVEEPQLGLSISGPHDTMVGETLTQIITVSNPGTGVAHDVVVSAKVPEGLEHPRGKVVEMGIGSLGAGETRELRLPLAAIAGGEGLLVVEARGGTNLSQNVQTSIKIAAPKLSIDLAGPGLRYVGRQAQYVSTVTNEGVAATDNVRIVHLVPEGFEFMKADKGGKFDGTTGSVSWFIGRLEAGESVQVACDLQSKQIGDYMHHVQASGESGTTATSKVTTRVDGSSKITMEVSDLDDPVEVGTQTAYEIRIRNDGTKAAQTLKLTCELPAGVELIDTTGPTSHFIEKGELHFKSLPELGAGAKAIYIIRVNGKQAGNLRMRARLTTSNNQSEPVVVEEVTKFYAD